MIQEHGSIISWGRDRVNAAIGAAASAGQAMPSSFLLEARATADCYVNFGMDTSVVATVDANSHLFPRGVQSIIVPVDSAGTPYTHFSVIAAGADEGTFQLCRLR